MQISFAISENHTLLHKDNLEYQDQCPDGCGPILTSQVVRTLIHVIGKRMAFSDTFKVRIMTKESCPKFCQAKDILEWGLGGCGPLTGEPEDKIQPLPPKRKIKVFRQAFSLASWLNNLCHPEGI